MYDTLHSAATSDSLAAYEACFGLPRCWIPDGPRQLLNGLVTQSYQVT